MLNTISLFSIFMNILITGGTGFIGSHLVDVLKKENHNLIILTRRPQKSSDPKLTYIQGDLTDSTCLKKVRKNVDAVFHNAAYAADYGQKKMIYQVNVRGTKTIGSFCQTQKIPNLIFTSSAGVYGFPNSLSPLDESSKKQPLNPYQLSKVQAEDYLQTLSNIRVSIIRPPLVLGAGGMPSKIMIERIIKGKMVYIGSGENTVPLVHVNDVARILKSALDKDTKGNVFNVVSFHCSIKQLMQKLSKKLGKPEPIKHIPYSLAYLTAICMERFSKNPSLTRFRVKTMGTTRQINANKAEKMLGYKAKYTLQSTVDDMVKWYQKSLLTDKTKKDQRNR